jgi:hypothetical protein
MKPVTFRNSPSPCTQCGEKVPEGRMRGVVPLAPAGHWTRGEATPHPALRATFSPPHAAGRRGNALYAEERLT